MTDQLPRLIKPTNPFGPVNERERAIYEKGKRDALAEAVVLTIDGLEPDRTYTMRELMAHAIAARDAATSSARAMADLSRAADAFIAGHGLRDEWLTDERRKSAVHGRAELEAARKLTAEAERDALKAEALEVVRAAEELNEVGLFNASPELCERVYTLRRDFLAKYGGTDAE